jgi:hypothetical protein
LSLKLLGVRFCDFCFFLDSSQESIVTRHLTGHPLDEWEQIFPTLHHGLGQQKQHAQHLIPQLFYPTLFYTGPDNLDEEEFPQQKYFVDILDMSEAGSDVYAKSKYAYEVFECQTFRDFVSLYGTAQVLLLADVIISFLDYTMEKFELCFLHYFTLSPFSWDICMRNIRPGFEFTKDKDMISFLEADYLGGPCGSVCKLLQAKNDWERLHHQEKDHTFYMRTKTPNILT